MPSEEMGEEKTLCVCVSGRPIPCQTKVVMVLWEDGLVDGLTFIPQKVIGVKVKPRRSSSG